MKLGVAVSKFKSSYGPIADAIQKTGIVDILSLQDQSNWHEYDHIIVFYNKVPIITNKPKGKIAWWMNDLRRPEDLVNPEEFNFDLIFICHKTFNPQYRDFYDKVVYYMPQCGHSQPFTKGRNIDWDVVFIGKPEGNRYYHKDRGDFFTKLSAHCNLKNIFGEGQTKDQHWIYNQTPINLALSYPMKEGTSNRLYNILASEGFCLTKYYPGLEKQFENKKHLVWFKDVEEAKELIDYYLAHPEERKEIAANGFVQYMRKHTASQRLDNMFKIMMGEEIQFRGYLEQYYE